MEGETRKVSKQKEMEIVEEAEGGLEIDFMKWENKENDGKNRIMKNRKTSSPECKIEFDFSKSKR